MNALVIGYGSIGSRHAKWLCELGVKVSVVSQQDVQSFPVYSSPSAAMQTKPFDYVVIANPTHEHYRTFEELACHDFSGNLLVEKPLFHLSTKIPPHRFQAVFVAYNLRFHPVIQKLRQILQNEKVLSVQTYVGQYLPTWRPLRDYQKSYSAKKSEGGGVLRDLSHELDYLNWLLGGWTSLVAVGGHYSHLEIDSDDIYHLILKTQVCPLVQVQLNYLDRTVRREILVHTDDLTIKADLIGNQLKINDEVFTYKVDPEFTYLSLHQAILQGTTQFLCSLDEGIEVLQMIEVAELSSKRKVWVDR
jgi:predicted dehydrogenase